MGKSFYFLSVFLFFLLISSSRSQIEVNLQFELNVSCSSHDECKSDVALCNSGGKCQCPFGFITEGDTCTPFGCIAYPDRPSCSQLYQSPYVTCDTNAYFCRCFPGFRLNPSTQKCELEKPKSRPLGGSCVADDQCGKDAKWTTAGECHCPAGFIPETEFTCTSPPCFSTNFCHDKITANTVCNGYCRCKSPFFKEDPETFKCVRVLPDSLRLGVQCKDSKDCGYGASCTIGNKPICKCKLGYLATSDTECREVQCSKDEHCHKRVSPLTICAYINEKNLDTSSCRCKNGKDENPATNECYGS